MKQFNKLSILIVCVLVTSVVATVDLCCADIEPTTLGLLEDLGYNGDAANIGFGCTPLEDSCEFLATACQESLADDLIGINCKPAGFTAPTGNLTLCCGLVVPADDVVAKQLLSEAEYNGSPPYDVATPCTQVGDSPCTLLDQRCQEGFLNNTFGINCTDSRF